MLDVGFSELLVFAIIALLVLGPEKLPDAARFVAKWYGKFKRFIGNLQTEIDQELHLSEFREEMQNEINRITELERRLEQQLDALKQQSASATVAPSTESTSENRSEGESERIPSQQMPTLTYTWVNVHALQHVPFKSNVHTTRTALIPNIKPLQNPSSTLKIAV